MGITEMQANLESKVLNYAIALDIYETGDWHSSEPIYDEEFFVVLSPGHRLAEHDAIRRVDLASEVFLIPGTDMPVLNRKLDYALGMLPSYLNGTIYKDVWAVLDLVSAGRGIAIAGGHNRQTHPHLLFKPFADIAEPLTIPVSLIWRTELEKFRSTSKHIAMLKKAVADISRLPQVREAALRHRIDS